MNNEKNEKRCVCLIVYVHVCNVCVRHRGSNKEETEGGKKRKQLKVKTTEQVRDRRQMSGRRER